MIKDKKLVIVIPSEFPGGLAARLSPHFAYCETYTLTTIKNNVVLHVTTRPNIIQESNVKRAIQNIAELQTNILIVRGIGLHPLAILQQKGIKIYYSKNLPTVSTVLSSFLQGMLIPYNQSPHTSS
ncbi:NifB/NifX family molybdenum-iron cluster-binding protein [Lawsonia intracellularis]|uniref:Dinitrogenase iron-molybdenum cofactor biosynthesis domain-containing protein n=1 Tax=Lawsonia intracellularis (strain PHE/MN1-00) TaxID=363253 RepID=Q1MR41_LAWIP|nr:NifB/NifX family molybdenum-iron cluster-binding protein [Lawsonia intracellularis]AGC49894.1 dinitrogenase iron-molybdenum cofactor biosynthesis protein [Lawsonia intracellularis N343]KAA0205394.1 hypothetical protein C4K43_02760 [Lawsonia intracellularis]MBZ3892068.1 NifB/NifX family molybdenum-iron cluster-binding protein [Lawsonia intracellularis]OMQ04656.1 hypothetical protein BW722_02600 [Lawsonia intracellularis]RBN32057.1 hypothetical protein DR194_03615 [Lawsonia intracellularis]